MERLSHVNIFESDRLSEIEYIQKKLLILQINSEYKAIKDDEEELMVYQLNVDLKDEQKAFDCIDDYLLNNEHE